jgi:hypothetical protein
VETRTVDVVLASLLIVGGVIGAQFGVRAGAKFSAERLRAVLGFLVLGTALKLLSDLIITPEEPFVLGALLLGQSG